MSAPQYSTRRLAGREHFPEFPKGFIAIRIVQLVLSVVILGLCGFGVTFLVRPFLEAPTRGLGVDEHSLIINPSCVPGIRRRCSQSLHRT